MHVPPRIGRRELAAFAITTVVVMASVGSCHMPQPKLPSLGSVGARPAIAGVVAARAETSGR